LTKVKVVLVRRTICHCRCESVVLPERDYVTFGHMLSHIRLSSVCLSSVTFVRCTQPVKIFSNVLMPFCTLAIR